MRLPTRQTHSTTPHILTAMLLLTLLVSVQFATLAAFRVVANAPVADAAFNSMTTTPARSPNRVSIQVTLERAQPRWTVSGRTIDSFGELRQLLTDIATADPITRVILDIAPDVPLGHVVDLDDACREVHLDPIEFAVVGTP